MASLMAVCRGERKLLTNEKAGEELSDQSQGSLPLSSRLHSGMGMVRVVSVRSDLSRGSGPGYIPPRLRHHQTLPRHGGYYRTDLTSG